jgi:hypothetical protein
MRCKAGDLAIVLRSVSGKNEGRIVSVAQYIGYYHAEESFEYNGIRCQVPITDNYWWITSPNEMETYVGPTTKAYGPDTWLKPIRPDVLDDGEETGEDIYKVMSTIA